VLRVDPSRPVASLRPLTEDASDLALIGGIVIGAGAVLSTTEVEPTSILSTASGTSSKCFSRKPATL
jgi:hypothetical protein